MSDLVSIRLVSFKPAAAHPHLFGRFDGDELNFVEARDLGREWTRQAKESAEAFERRIIADVLACELPSISFG
jgi:hypothetical protein